MAILAERFEPDADRVAAEVVDGEAILINLTTGVYYSMDGAAGLVWTLIEQRQSMEAILEGLIATYAVSAEQAEEDLARLMETLLQEELIVPASHEAAPGAREQVGGRLPYHAPELSIYRDMSVLLALDPPMPGLKATPWQESRPLA